MIEEKTVAAIPVRITFASLHTKWLSYYYLLHFVFKMFVSVINGLAIYCILWFFRTLHVTFVLDLRYS